MRCPHCGTELVIKAARSIPEIDWNACGDDFPLYLHHPLRGIDSAPGDSWSISWVK